MASRPEEICPHCGEAFRLGRMSCPHCGSDAETGWLSPDEQGSGVELGSTHLADDDYDAFLEQEGLRPADHQKESSSPLTAIILLLAIAAALVLMTIL